MGRWPEQRKNGWEEDVVVEKEEKINLIRTDKEADKWMANQAPRCLERGDEDITEWCH